MRKTCTFVAAIGAAVLATAALARAEGDLAFPEASMPTFGRPILDSELVASVCREAAAVDVTKLGADVAVCFGPEATSSWQAAATAARDFEAAVATYSQVSRTDAPTPNCGRSPASSSPQVQALSSKVDDARKALEKAKQDRDAVDLVKKKAQDAFEIEQKTYDDAASKAGVSAAELQAISHELQTRKSNLTDAETALSAAVARVATAQQEFDDAKAKLTKSTKEVANEAQKAVMAKLDEFDTALDRATSAQRSPQDFEEFVQDKRRRDACLAIRQQFLDSIGAAARAERAKRDKAEAQAARVGAHRSDLMRKAQSTVSGAFSGNGLVEQPGSPDKAIFSIMSAVGADSHTNGSQLVMTVNVASLLTANEAERLTLDPTWRNLVLRANLPLSSTDPIPETGANVASNQPATSASPSVTRLSMILGSSLFDETDTRLPSHDTCYQAATAYSPFGAKERTDERRADERKDYFDICNRLAAQASRLSWRVGAGFYTPNNTEHARTKADLVVGALVYAPSSNVYFNAFYQRVIEPLQLDNVGFGASFAGNVGGAPSGADSWSRVGLDILGICSIPKGSDVDDGRLEFRVTPTIRTKVANNSIAAIGVGPRFFTRGDASPALLATFALVYDADALIDQTLVTPTK